MEQITPLTALAGACIEYREFDLADIELNFDQGKLTQQGVKIESVVIGGELLGYSDRFGISLATLLRQSPSIFTLFGVGEVIARAIEKRVITGRAMIAIDRTEPAGPRALAVAPSGKKMMNIEHIREFLASMKEMLPTIRYLGDATFEVSLDLFAVFQAFNVRGREYAPSLTLRLPADGWGKPAALSSLRMTDSGLLIAAAALPFRTSVEIGKTPSDFVSVLHGFVQSFQDKERASRLRNRIETASLTPSSLEELHGFQRAIFQTAGGSPSATIALDMAVSSARNRGFNDLAGLPVKLRRSVPSPYTLIELLIFAAGVIAKTPGIGLPVEEWLSSRLGTTGGYDLEHAVLSAPPLESSVHIPSGTVVHRQLLSATAERLPCTQMAHAKFDQGEPDDGYQPDDL